MSRIEFVLPEDRLLAPPKEFVARANVKPGNCDAIHARAAREFAGFRGDHSFETIERHTR